MDRLLCGPKRRCVSTAAHVAAATGLPAQVNVGLDDLDYGDWTWRLHEEVRASEPAAFTRWRTHPQLMRFPGGESLQDLLTRAADAVRLLLDDDGAGAVALVTHDSVIRALVLLFMGLPLDAYHRLAVAPCSVTELAIQHGQAKLVRFDETAHL